MRIPKSRPSTKNASKAISKKILFKSEPYIVVPGRLNTFQIMKAHRGTDQVLTYRKEPSDGTRYFFTLDAAKEWIEAHR